MLLHRPTHACRITNREPCYDNRRRRTARWTDTKVLTVVALVLLVVFRCSIRSIMIFSLNLRCFVVSLRWSRKKIGKYIGRSILWVQQIMDLLAQTTIFFGKCLSCKPLELFFPLVPSGDFVNQHKIDEVRSLHPLVVLLPFIYFIFIIIL